jgi:hypothetical protein
MIGIPTALLIATVLLLSLLLLATRGSAVARRSPGHSDAPLLEDASALPPCPPEFVARIFDPADSLFIARTNSSQLQSLFRTERRLVALFWVQQTSAAIQSIMREHKQASRQSHDLDFSTEARLLLLYSQLMLVCGLLCVALQAYGPQRVRSLALYADGLSRRLTDVEHGFRLALSSRRLDDAVPSRNH